MSSVSSGGGGNRVNSIFAHRLDGGLGVLSENAPTARPDGYQTQQVVVADGQITPISLVNGVIDYLEFYATSGATGTYQITLNGVPFDPVEIVGFGRHVILFPLDDSVVHGVTPEFYFDSLKIDIQCAVGGQFVLYYRAWADDYVEPVAAPVDPPIVPPAGSWAGYDDATVSLTNSSVVLDLSDDLATAAPNLIRISHGSREHVVNGGFFGNGSNRFNAIYDGNEHYLGIGLIQNFAGVGDSSRVTIGRLIKFSQDFIDGHMQHNSWKHSILVKNPNDSAHQRPMVVSQPNTTTMTLSPANGTVANTSDDPVGNPRPYNDWNTIPDFNSLGGVWCWVTEEVDCNGPPGTLTVRVWDQNSVYDGSSPHVMHMNIDYGAGETFGGVIDWLDILGAYNAAHVGPDPGSSYFEIERVEMMIGSAGLLTPPVGFPGSAR